MAARSALSSAQHLQTCAVREMPAQWTPEIMDILCVRNGSKTVIADFAVLQAAGCASG